MQKYYDLPSYFKQCSMEFVVIDIEGQPELSEIAIIDCQGKLIYEALSSDNSNNSVNLPNLKSLKTILIEF